ncbi:MAG: hypothetical protein OXT65_06280 [Alphaproteobacteria bacterium]|nr:hypothetical protein [Alphaproteobacteria bacterium]
MTVKPVLKSIKRFSEERLVRAMVRSEKWRGEKPVSFPQSSVDMITGISEGMSHIFLKTGDRVEVAMPHLELEAAIYAPDMMVDSVLDLTAISGGSARKKQPMPYLTERDIGAYVEGEGVYMGTWTPDCCLGRVFNVFAAPEDLKTPDYKGLNLEFSVAAIHVGKVKDFWGYDGSSYMNDKELCVDMNNGGYDGEWFIPPMALLESNENGSRILDDFYSSTAVKGTLTERWYWTSTDDGSTNDAWNVNFFEKRALYDDKSQNLSIRLFRAVPRGFAVG